MAPPPAARAATVGASHGGPGPGRRRCHGSGQASESPPLAIPGPAPAGPPEPESARASGGADSPELQVELALAPGAVAPGPLTVPLAVPVCAVARPRRRGPRRASLSPAGPPLPVPHLPVPVSDLDATVVHQVAACCVFVKLSACNNIYSLKKMVKQLKKSRLLLRRTLP